MRPLALLLLIACAAEAPPPAAEAPPPASAPPTVVDPDLPPVAPPPGALVTDTTCGAEDYAEGLFGANIAAVTLPAELNHRVIYPDQVVTQDHRPERLNIHVAEDGTVLRLTCG